MNVIARKPIVKIQEPPIPEPRRFPWGLFFIAITAILGIVAAYKGVDFLELDENGEVQLVPKREGKLQKALKELKEAEQYVLYATKSQYYPCYKCEDGDRIFLNIGEVWRYGSTVKKEIGRYKKTLEGASLQYYAQYQGSLQECLQQELEKIFNYAKLPENIKRTKPLIRPPGNKVDR